MLKNVAAMFTVSDVAKSAAFYRDRLGFEITLLFESDHIDPYAIVERDGFEVHLAQRPGAVPDWMLVGINVHVADVDAIYAEFAANGAFDDAFPRNLDVIREHPPEDKEYGMRDFIFVDPDGYTHVFGQVLG